MKQIEDFAHKTIQNQRQKMQVAYDAKLYRHVINYIQNLEEGITDADVIIMLRLQKERMHEALISTDEYYKTYGLTEKKIKSAKKDVIVMHPGPINRGIEIDSKVADGKNSVILDQVSSGIAIRMAIMSLIFKNRKSN